jgi:hypothetical protein
LIPITFNNDPVEPNLDVKPQVPEVLFNSILINTPSSYLENFSSLDKVNVNTSSTDSSDVPIPSPVESNAEVLSNLLVLNVPAQNAQKEENIYRFEQVIVKKEPSDNSTENSAPSSSVETNYTIPIQSSNQVKTEPEDCLMRCNVDSNLACKQELQVSDLHPSRGKIVASEMEISTCSSNMSNNSEKKQNEDSNLISTEEVQGRDFSLDTIKNIPKYMDTSSCSPRMSNTSEKQLILHGKSVYHCALILKFFKPNYLITVPAIHQLFASFGNVLKIKIINLSNPIVFVEFSTSSSATEASSSLKREKQMFCYNLKVYFFDETKINVKQNDLFNWNKNLENKSEELQCEEKGCVMFVTCTTLHKLNPQKLFNLFCNYGNITQIQFTHNENIALVQMESKSQVECTIKYLNHSKIYGCHMLLKISTLGEKIKSELIACPLANGSRREEMFSLEFKRFIPDKQALTICKPSNMLRLNITVEVSRAFIFEVVTSMLGHTDVLVDRIASNTFILTFKFIVQSTEALILCNNMSVVDPSTSEQFYLNLMYYKS